MSLEEVVFETVLDVTFLVSSPVDRIQLAFGGQVTLEFPQLTGLKSQLPVNWGRNGNNYRSTGEMKPVNWGRIGASETGQLGK